MKDQFDVWRFRFPDKGEHPVVIISHPDRCARAALVNVLFCTSQRQSRPPYPYEVLLNGADGMDWETFCDCSILYAVNRICCLAPRPGDFGAAQTIRITARLPLAATD